MSIAPQPTPLLSQPFAEANEVYARQPVEGHGQAIPSEKLLCGRASVTIDHEGIHYVLRATRAGKLILTK